jgi:hypothetical protein
MNWFLDTSKWSELVNSIRDQSGGFTRIVFQGPRRVDKAPSCYIELIRNPIEVYAKGEFEVEKERLGLQSYWSWEHKLLQ